MQDLVTANLEQLLQSSQLLDAQNRSSITSVQTQAGVVHTQLEAFLHTFDEQVDKLSVQERSAQKEYLLTLTRLQVVTMYVQHVRSTLEWIRHCSTEHLYLQNLSADYALLINTCMSDKSLQPFVQPVHVTTALFSKLTQIKIFKTEEIPEAGLVPIKNTSASNFIENSLNTGFLSSTDITAAIETVVDEYGQQLFFYVSKDYQKSPETVLRVREKLIATILGSECDVEVGEKNISRVSFTVAKNTGISQLLDKLALERSVLSIFKITEQNMKHVVLEVLPVKLFALNRLVSDHRPEAVRAYLQDNVFAVT